MARDDTPTPSDLIVDEMIDEEKMIDEEESQSRRDFLVGLGKWSKIIIGGALLGASLVPVEEAAAWINGRGRGGGAWVNRRGGGGGGGRWVNRRGGGGGAWVNRRGGGGGSAWVNRR